MRVSHRVSNQLWFWRSLQESKARRLTDSLGSEKAPTCLKAAPSPAQRKCYPVEHEALLEASEFIHAGDSPLSVCLYWA